MEHKIDILSDSHWDFWIKIEDPEYSQIKKFKKLFDMIIPKDHSDTLLLSGDIGHGNLQNELAFNLLKEHYKNICWIEGNHVLYMISENQMKKYNYNSFNRLNEMIEIASKIDGVHYLHGNIVNIDGLNIGGCGMWYDFSYGIKNHSCTIQYLEEVWRYRSNDSRLIKVENTVHRRIDNLEYFKEQYALMDKIYKDCDIVMSHIGPDYSMVPDHYKEPTTSFYYFDGERMLSNMNHNQIYLYGHTHDNYDYISKSGGTRLICNPLGYPYDYNWITKKISQRIKTISIHKD